tara:strand:+ start:249 stop:587 length:339 start_codon:yes stop_codon:yes gene_type:complete
MHHKFQRNLIEAVEATPNQRKKEFWDIEGILKNRSNRRFKFDLRPTIKIKNETGKRGYFNSKADKLVFDVKNQWIIVDMEELFEYLKTHKLRKVQLEDLISKLDWNIILPKN